MAKLQLNLNPTWESPFIPQELIAAAQNGDTTTWQALRAQDRFQAQRVTAYNMALDWGQLAQSTFAHVNSSVGFATDTVSQVTGIVNSLVLGPQKSVEDIIEGVIRSTVGIAVNAVAVVPIVGWAIKAVSDAAWMLYDAFKSPVPPPKVYAPMFSYLEERDEWLVNRTIYPHVGTSYDWTQLYMPYFEPWTWRLERRDSGWLFRGDRSPGAALGFIPDTQQVTREIQAWFLKSVNVPGDAVAFKGIYPGALAEITGDTGTGSVTKGVSYKSGMIPSTSPSKRGGDLADSMDVGMWVPGVAQTMTLLDSQVQGHRVGGHAIAQAQTYTINPDMIADAWKEYVDSAFAFAQKVWMGRGFEGSEAISHLSEDSRRLLALAFIKQFIVTEHGGVTRKAGAFAEISWNFDLTNKPATIYTAWIKPWAKRMKARQRAFLDTYLVAIPPPESGAFKENTRLVKQYIQNRNLLLDSPARFEVPMNDVLDPLYWRRLFDATKDKGAFNAAPGTGMLTPAAVAKMGPFPTMPKGGTGYEGFAPSASTPAWVYAAAFGLLGVGAYMWRKK
jgi:hypothetical protein